MRKLLALAGVVLMFGTVLLAQNKKPAATDDAARAAAIKLYKSLTDEQKKLAVKDFNDKERWKQDFPAVERPGLPYKMLTAEQKAMIDEVIESMCSEYGSRICLEVEKQTDDNRRYLFFFGSPEEGKPFAWRVAMHHLTLIYAEFGKDGKTNEFGPVLLGGNPVNKLWDEEEKILLDLRAALTDDEVKKAEGPGVSGQDVGDKGVKVGALNDKAKSLAKKLLEKRLDVFSADRRKVLEKRIEADGGVEKLRLTLSGDATKGHLNGGTYSWKIGGASVLCDWQTVGKNHIHMTVRAKPKA
jgi:hypothetical protein